MGRSYKLIRGHGPLLQAVCSDSNARPIGACRMGFGEALISPQAVLRYAPAMQKPVLYCLAALILAACGNDDALPPESPPAPAPLDLRVMSFNIEWGGTHVSFDKVVEAIQRADPDIVGIQEAEGNLQRLADTLGWHYELRNYVISRYPLFEPPGADGKYVLVEVEPGRMVAIANVHLPSDPYGPDQVRDGAPLEDVLALEREARLPEIQATLDAVAGLVANGTPVIMTGDFNAPSHEDWTEVMVGRRPFLRYAVDWPVSRALSAAGFRDSWRVIHPDPVTHPGLTWWAGRPPLKLYAPGENDAQDRIDFIWYAGTADANASTIVGEDGAPDVSIAVTPWPSDHRAVVSDFSVWPAAMPVLVSTERRVYRLGEEIAVVYRQAGEAVIRVHADEDTAVLLKETVEGDGRLVIPVDRIVSGHYVLRMSRVNEEPMYRDFWVLEPDARPEIVVEGKAFEAGKAIGFSWKNAPGHRNDYVATFDAGTESGYENGLAWTYVHALPEGRLQMDASTAEWGWPLPPGRYVLRLMKDDGYESLAESAEFEVRSADADVQGR